MISFSEASNLAIHALAYIAAAGPGARISARAVARKLKRSESHVAKVLNRLVGAGLLESTRGAAGGFRLTVASDELSVLEVIEAIDGRVAAPRCLLGQPICRPGTCIFADVFAGLWADIEKHLSETKLTDFRIKP